MNTKHAAPEVFVLIFLTTISLLFLSYLAIVNACSCIVADTLQLTSCFMINKNVSSPLVNSFLLDNHGAQWCC